MNKFSCPSCAETVTIMPESMYENFCKNCSNCKEGVILRVIKMGHKKHFILRVVPHEKFIPLTEAGYPAVIKQEKL